MTAPTSFGLGFFLRVAVPGVVALLLVLPLLPDSVPIRFDTVGLTTIGVLSAGGGLVLLLLDSVIYQVFEGRTLWPSKVRDKRTRRLQDRLNALWRTIGQLQRQMNLPGQTDDDKRTLKQKLAFLYDRALNFPFFRQDKRPHAIWPTRFGNVMASYEYYPQERYGMDSAFYWYRIWLILPDDTRKEYDNSWSLGQVWLYISAASAAAVLLYCALTIWWLLIWRVSGVVASIPDDPMHRLIVSLTLPKPGQRLFTFIGAQLGAWDLRIPLLFIVIALASAILSKIAYEVATLQHRISGEYFKSLFDLYRQDIEVRQAPSAAEIEDWWDAYFFLQYFRGSHALGRRKVRTGNDQAWP
jgi:hypothetical protein